MSNRHSPPLNEAIGRPAPVGPPAWVFPDPGSADENGLLALGADLAPETLVHAYRHGIFPWPHLSHGPLPWFSPDPRGVIDVDRIRVSRSLAQRMRRCGWTTTVDVAFDAVVAGCAARPGEGTWITPEMCTAYGELNALRWAHSLEVWNGARLVGGIYGVAVGACFTGESMFHGETDASKVAMVDLARRWGDAGGRILDVQMTTPHLASMGAVEVDRTDFLARLHDLRDRTVLVSTDRLVVSRLVLAG